MKIQLRLGQACSLKGFAAKGAERRLAQNSHITVPEAEILIMRDPRFRKVLADDKEGLASLKFTTQGFGAKKPVASQHEAGRFR